MKTILFAIAGLLFAVAVSLGAFQLGRLYQRPLAEPLQLNQPEKLALAQIEQAAAEGAEKPADDAQALPKEKGACGETGSLLILFTGADFSGGVWPLGADALRMVKADFDAPAITSVTFPRDLWVQTPALAAQDIAAARLGLAYHYQKEATMGEDKARITAATRVIAQTLVDNFELPAEHYFTLQLDNVAEMIDTIGGAPVNLPESITTESGVTFPAGQQVLDGALATEFVRAYRPGGDAARRQRQTLFLKALQDKVISADVLLKAPELVQQFDQAIVTDLSPRQIQALACLAGAVPPGEVAYYEIDETLTTPREVGEPVPVLDPDVETILARLREWLDL